MEKTGYGLPKPATASKPRKKRPSPLAKPRGQPKNAHLARTCAYRAVLEPYQSLKL